MSIIKSIKQILGLHPAAENHFWDGSVPNELTLKRGTPDVPGTELIKALNGVLSFPNQGQSLGFNGYVKLPGGLIVQWGVAPAGATGSAIIPLSIPFPTAFFIVNATIRNLSANASANAIPFNLASFELAARAFDETFSPESCSWMAVGY